MNVYGLRKPTWVARPAPASVGQPSTEPQRDGPPFDVMLGAMGRTPQYGILGKAAGRRVALDLNGCNTISLFGVQGFGKSYTLGVIAEMAAREVPGISKLQLPLGTVIFHYHRSEAYEPEHVAAMRPNDKRGEVDRLHREYGVSPTGLDDIVLLTPADKVEERQREYPHLFVEPLKFGSAEIGPEAWRFLLGAIGNDSLYVRQLIAIMRRFRDTLTLDKLREEIKLAKLPEQVEKIALDRLSIAEPYIDDSRHLGSLLRPGRTIIVDLRDQWIEKDEALGLFVVMLRIFGPATCEGMAFNKLLVFDEAHKYLDNPALTAELVSSIREMRHHGLTVLIASQDPISVARSAIELTSVLILHRMTSPAWIKHLKGAIVSLDELNVRACAELPPGEALIWTQRSNATPFMRKPQLVTIRPRFTAHGGGTKTAVR